LFDERKRRSTLLRFSIVFCEVDGRRVGPKPILMIIGFDTAALGAIRKIARARIAAVVSAVGAKNHVSAAAAVGKRVPGFDHLIKCSFNARVE